MERKIVETDVLIIGGGTAGCYAAIRLGENSELKVAIAEKANIRRSGCLAAGVNALNAYISPGHEPEDYVAYAARDAEGIVREDLLLDICQRLNHVTQDMERRGLTILKDEDGRYVTRGWRNLKIMSISQISGLMRIKYVGHMDSGSGKRSSMNSEVVRYLWLPGARRECTGRIIRRPVPIRCGTARSIRERDIVWGSWPGQR